MLSSPVSEFPSLHGTETCKSTHTHTHIAIRGPLTISLNTHTAQTSHILLIRKETMTPSFSCRHHLRHTHSPVSTLYFPFYTFTYPCHVLTISLLLQKQAPPTPVVGEYEKPLSARLSLKDQKNKGSAFLSFSRNPENTMQASIIILLGTLYMNS